MIFEIDAEGLLGEGDPLFQAALVVGLAKSYYSPHKWHRHTTRSSRAQSWYKKRTAGRPATREQRLRLASWARTRFQQQLSESTWRGVLSWARWSRAC